jgi:hypothetical protein
MTTFAWRTTNENEGEAWTMNAVYYIDALSMAVPYCHIVVPDREMASPPSRSHAAERHGIQITTSLSVFPTLSRELAGSEVWPT